MQKTIKRSPRYPTGVVAEYLGVNAKTLINFENAGLTRVEKNSKNRRKYSQMDILKIILILHLLNIEGLNYKGCKLILKLVGEEDINYDTLGSIVSNELLEEMTQKAVDI